ncbi:DNA replication and repair protein RecF [Actinobaculum suis]|uniref:DNA replication and repair protein RecF n=1 Tax=Actinobaculum suis TaxID=1657 RepID=A0A1G7A4S2_9ACTO|nr:DNA replication/repair protein RecF [Actinobaculum suis]MDY5152687.1 DNA replication/repair protein RecF [Actinobaculum suis]SDE09928.1 DNA replication and repair protein RecF [Actinobaculum suis]
MYISDIALADFRNYEREVVSFSPGINILTGKNGQGKTNLVEAVAYLATLGSHRVSSDNALVRQSANAAVIQARTYRGTSPTTVQVEIYAGRANRARINRAPAKPADIVGIVRCVLFAPEDLGIIRAEPAIRRAFLDDLMIQLRPRMAGVRAEYNKVLQQRAALLRSLSSAAKQGQNVSLENPVLDIFDAQLAKLGGEITAARAEIVRQLRPFVAEYYNLVSGTQSGARIDYKASANRGFFSLPGPERISAEPELAAAITNNDAELAQPAQATQRLQQLLQERRAQEIERGQNLVGPQRDDLQLSLGQLPAKGYASHGESWSYALALRLAEWQVLRADDSGEWSGDGEPILILDDVFAELDGHRRRRLAELVASAGQVMITAAVGDDLPATLQGKTFRIHAGRVHPESEIETNSAPVTNRAAARSEGIRSEGTRSEGTRSEGTRSEGGE